MTFCVVVAMSACKSAIAEDAESKPTEQPAAEKATEEAAEEPDPFIVPDGDADVLAEYLGDLKKLRPKSAEERKKWGNAVLEASERILAGEADDPQIQLAVRMQTRFLRTPDEFEALADRLSKEGRGQLVRFVRGEALGRQISAIRGGTREEAAELFRELAGKIEKHLADGPVSNSDLGIVKHAARMAEMIGHDKTTAESCGAFGKILTASDNKKAVRTGKFMEGVARRFDLVGKQMEVEGTLVAGEEFDWSDYDGKVVLIDFWSTSCFPCVREIPNMMKLYQKYHDLGFEIVGISHDRSREQLEKFIERIKIPWAIIFNDKRRSPTILHYGVMGIPTMILIDKGGNVVSIRARGKTLTKELERLLGPVESEEESAEEENGPGKINL